MQCGFSVYPPCFRSGYVRKYAQNHFTFATVKAAGHLVPLYQPESAFSMIHRFINNEPL
jgi:carboxypeptidase C (cathepsin A)